MATAPKHPDPPARKHDEPAPRPAHDEPSTRAKRDDDARPPVTREPDAPSGVGRDPQEMKLELAARDVQRLRDASGPELHEYVPGEGVRDPGEYLSVADEQRARSAEMEREGGPHNWMRMHETSPRDNEPREPKKTVDGVRPHAG